MDDRLRWVEALKAQGWGYYRAAFTHGRRLWEHALAAFRQAASLAREAGDDAALLGALSGEATVLRSSGDVSSIEAAIGLYGEAISLLRTLGRDKEVPDVLIGLALAYRDLVTVDPDRAGELVKAVSACREALEAAKKAGQVATEALAASTVGDLCLVMADADLREHRDTHLREAMAFYGQAEKLWDERDPDGLALARLGLAQAYIAAGRNLEGARDLLGEVMSYYEKCSGPPVSGPVRYQIAQAKELTARLLEAEGKPDEAAEARHEALDVFEALGFDRR